MRRIFQCALHVLLSLVLSGCDKLAGLAADPPEPAVTLASGGAPTGPAPTAPPPPPVHLPSAMPPSFADLAQMADSGVVFVRTVKRTRAGFRNILGESKGSGFIFDPDGKILTNYHVVAGAEAVQVELKDARTLMASIVGADPLTDLAILKVDATGLPALPLGDSDKIRVGDWVVAIGNPFGLEHTVSAGIISAKERTGRDVDLGNTEAYYSFLQTDASINPGNSGGPLLDLSGHVVGINTAINQGANNIGFAIPVNMVKRLLPQLLKEGRIRRAAIGVVVSDVSSEAMAHLGLQDREGALIQDVAQGGPAAQGGVLRGDVVVHFDGQAIKTPDALRWNASLAPIGEEVTLVVIRGGQKHELVLRPTELRMR